ncbi:MAG: hypothetical protein NC082_02410 [Clostridiales bacterium]|nr:hypothetical protein [Clostridiales bacterium]
MNSLKYKDMRDRCYGLTGMAMSMVVLNGEDLLSSINLDAPTAEEMMEFTPQYYFAGNPRLSARLAWNQLVEHYTLTMGMLVANVLSRYYVNRKEELTPELLQVIHSYLVEEGKETCQLDEDEINTIFNKNFSYMQRLFRHHGVQSIIDDVAGIVMERRRLSVNEVLEAFRPLAML